MIFDAIVLDLKMALWALSAYFVGAFPTGYLIARCAGIADITQHGSGTIGATNVGRHLGIGYFFLVFLIDAGKAAATMLLVPAYAQSFALALLMLGNTYSPIIGFTGGKGVATLLGILLAIDYRLAVFFVLIWAVALVVLRAVGLASSIALAILIICLFFLTPDTILACRIAFAALWSLYMHKEHIKKLLYRVSLV